MWKRWNILKSEIGCVFYSWNWPDFRGEINCKIIYSSQVLKMPEVISNCGKRFVVQIWSPRPSKINAMKLYVSWFIFFQWQQMLTVNVWKNFNWNYCLNNCKMRNKMWPWGEMVGKWPVILMFHCFYQRIGPCVKPWWGLIFIKRWPNAPRDYLWIPLSPPGSKWSCLMIILLFHWMLRLK